MLSKGFGATSIDELIAAVGIRKAVFFYHFKDKTELAKALLERYIEQDDEILRRDFQAAPTASMRTPCHGFLIGLKMLAEVFADLPGGHPGCMVRLNLLSRANCSTARSANSMPVPCSAGANAFSHGCNVSPRSIRRVSTSGLDDLADMLSGIADGAHHPGRGLPRTVRALPRQLMLYRDFVRLGIHRPGVATEQTLGYQGPCLR